MSVAPAVEIPDPFNYPYLVFGTMQCSYHPSRPVLKHQPNSYFSRNDPRTIVLKNVDSGICGIVKHEGSLEVSALIDKEISILSHAASGSVGAFTADSLVGVSVYLLERHKSDLKTAR